MLRFERDMNIHKYNLFELQNHPVNQDQDHLNVRPPLVGLGTVSTDFIKGTPGPIWNEGSPASQRRLAYTPPARPEATPPSFK